MICKRSTYPSLVYTFGKTNCEADLFPIRWCFLKRLYQPWSVSHFNGFFVSTPSATVFETGPKKEAMPNQRAVKVDLALPMVEEEIVFFVPQKTARKMRCANGW